MAGVRYPELQSRPLECLAFTSLTREELQPLVPPFEPAFHTRMAAGRLEGKPRTARRVPGYQHGPRPTPEDRLLCILVARKTYALQVGHGRLCGLGQGQAHQWMHGLLPARLAALRALGAAPARSLTALAQRLGVSEADAATGGSHPLRDPTSHCARLPPGAHDGTARRLVRPPDAAAQTAR